MTPPSTKIKNRPVGGSTVEVASNAQVDLYHSVVAMGWLGYLGVFVGAFLLANARFGCLHYPQQSDFALVATIRGLDETIAQTVPARQAYRRTDIRWQHRFVDMFTENEGSGRSLIDLACIHDTSTV